MKDKNEKKDIEQEIDEVEQVETTLEEDIDQAKATTKDEEVAQADNDTSAEEEKPKSLETLLDEANEKCADLSDKNLRLMAEFDNFRKRTLKEKADLIKSGGENVLKDMIPLVDDFERAIQSMEDSNDAEAVKEGLDLIYNKFVKFLNDHSVKAIDVVGEIFDDELHEAVSLFPVEDKDKKGKVIDCMEKGYVLNDKVIRFPKVIVGE